MGSASWPLLAYAVEVERLVDNFTGPDHSRMMIQWHDSKQTNMSMVCGAAAAFSSHQQLFSIASVSFAAGPIISLMLMEEAFGIPVFLALHADVRYWSSSRMR